MDRVDYVPGGEPGHVTTGCPCDCPCGARYRSDGTVEHFPLPAAGD